MSAQILFPKLEKKNVRKVGFVGADELTILRCGLTLDYVKEFCKKLMIRELEKGDYIFVSGRCSKKGIDVICEEMADKLGIQKEVYPAEVNQWKDKYFCKECGLQKQWDSLKAMLKEHSTLKDYPYLQGRLKGYRSRNIQIAEACDILYDIEPKGSCEHCGGRGFTSKHPNFLLYGRRCKFCHGTGVYSGGTWTLNHAKKLGKEVHQVIIE